MVTVQFSRREMVNLLRRAGPREAASEACGADPARLTSIKPGRGGTARHHQKRSHQPHGRQPMTAPAGNRPAGGMPPPRLPCADSMSVNAKGAGRA